MEKRKGKKGKIGNNGWEEKKKDDCEEWKGEMMRKETKKRMNGRME